MIGRLLWGGALAAVLAACGGAEAKPSPGGVVDSIVPRDTAIARFQRSLPLVTAFQGGAPSRDRLVRSFVAALEKRDTAALRALALDRSEFGWLYYPTNPEGLPPYNLTPQLMWFLLEGRNEQGVAKLLDRRAGRPLHYLGYRCEGEPSRQGGSVVWGPCVVLRRSEQGDTVSERLFGQIVARGGRYKFVSYANQL
ncbi:MAG TPA: hypothetical protein VFB61_12500 [Gemmatimonadales bacterium]|nr:hypothetical protein [Gemmatimonadales bacterium]